MTVNQVYEEVLCVLVDAKRQHAQDITIRLAPQQGLISVLSADETFSRHCGAGWRLRWPRRL